jgi:hypothetical protein
MELSWNELYAIWRSTTDTNYVQSLERAGDGKGLEVYGQLLAQLARVSTAINRTTQAMFLLPFSGQEAPPAAGESRSLVTLTVTRTFLLGQALTLPAGVVWFEESEYDWGEDPGQLGGEFLTGHRFTPVADTMFSSGQTSIEVACVAEYSGSSYNNARIGSIHNVVATPDIVSVTGEILVEGVNEILADPYASPLFVGMYVVIQGGHDVGAIRRIIGYEEGRLYLKNTASLLTPATDVPWRIIPWTEFGVSCTNAAMPTGGNIGTLDAIAGERGVIRHNGESDDNYRDRAAPMIDVVSPNAIRRSVSLALRPFGLKVGTLREAGLASLPGIFCDVPGTVSHSAFDLDAVTITGAPPGFIEGETVYQASTYATGRVAFLNGAFDSIVAVRGTFEAGSEFVGLTSGTTYIPGITGIGLANDDKYRYGFDFAEMRGFFMIGVPQIGLGEFGSAFDLGHADAFDVGFADGFPVVQAKANRAARIAADTARAYGVGFDICPD